MALQTPSMASSIGQDIVPAAQNVPIRQPTQPGGQVQAPTTTPAMALALQRKFDALKPKEIALFERYAWHDLNTYITKVNELCAKYQDQSWSVRIVNLIQPLFKTLSLHTGYIANSVQGSPVPVAPILGGIMCIMQIASNFHHFHERVGALLAKMGDKAPVLLEYEQDIYQNEPAIQDALIDIYGDIIDFSQACLNFFLNEDGKPKRSYKVWCLMLVKDFETTVGTKVEPFERHVSEFEQAAMVCDRRRLDSIKTTQEKQAADQQTFYQGFHRYLDQQDALKRKHEAKEERHKEQKREEQRREALCDWLPAGSYESDLDRKCGEHLEGTGMWFLQSDRYCGWKSSQKPDLLWLSGKPGCGKSVLAAIAIMDLDALKCPGVGLAYAYCRIGVTSLKLLALIVKQLCQQSPSLHEVFRSVSDSIRGRQDPTWSLIRSTFFRVAAQFSKVYIIVDGLDECEDRAMLAKFLASTVGNPKPIIKILVSSRPHYDSLVQAFSSFEHSITVDSGANEEDIKTYIDNSVSLENFKMEDDPSEFERIRQLLIQKAVGMFLWVDLIVKTLIDQPTPAQVMEMVQFVPSGLNATYNLCLGRIWRQPFARKIALMALLWILNAERPLTEAEIIEAIAMKARNRSLDKKNMVKPGDLLKTCGDLIRVDRESKKITLLHSSLRDYLTSNSQEQLDDDENVDQRHRAVMYHVIASRESTEEDYYEEWIAKDGRTAFETFSKLNSQAHEHIGEICLSYLLLETFDSGCIPNPEQQEKLATTSPFLSYAVLHWVDHVKKSTTGKCNDLMIDLALSPQHRQLCMQQHIFLVEKRFVVLDERSTPLHFLAMHGLSEETRKQPRVLEARHERDKINRVPLDYAMLSKSKSMALLMLEDSGIEVIDKLTIGETSPLHAAIESDWLDVLEILINKQYDLEHLAQDGFTPLIWAINLGKTGSALRLLQAQVNVNCIRKDGYTPLMLASYLGNDDLIQPLLDAGARVNVSGSGRDSTLHLAAYSKSLKIVERLLYNGADPRAVSVQLGSKTPLHYAAEKGACDIIDLLLQKGAETSDRSSDGSTALHIASNYGFVDAVKILIARGAKTDARDESGSLCIHRAAKFGHVELIEYLCGQLEKSLLESPDKNGITPLHWSARNGPVEAVKLLLNKGVGLSHKNNHHGNPLHLAIIADQVEIAMVLLEYGADPTERGLFGSPALHCATVFGCEEIVAHLLSNPSVDQNAVNDDGDTALHFASEYDQIRVLKQLLAASAGKDINRKNKNGRTALHVAALNGKSEIVSLLISNNALSLSDEASDLPIHLAASGGFDNVVSQFKDPAGFTSKGFKNGTALLFAASNGHMSTAKYLLEHQSDVNAKNDAGVTPLAGALSGEFFDLAFWLLNNDADPFICDEFGLTPLHIAALKGNIEVTKVLLAKDCNGLARDCWRETPFSRAIRSNSLDIINLLIQKEFDGSRMMGYRGTSPIHLAVSNGNKDMLNRLVERGADPKEISLAYGDSAMQYAASGGHIRCVRALKDYGVDPQHLNRYGYSAIMQASAARWLDVVKLLIRFGVDINVVESIGGWSPFLFAANARSPKIVQELAFAGANVNQLDRLGRNARDLAQGHPATLRQLDLIQNLEPSLPIERKRSEYAVTAIREMTTSLLELQHVSMTDECDRLVYMEELSYFLAFVSGIENDDLAGLCVSENVFAPEKSQFRANYHCDLCKHGRLNDFFQCKTCTDVSLCSTCFQKYDTNEDQPKSAPLSFTTLQNLEEAADTWRCDATLPVSDAAAVEVLAKWDLFMSEDFMTEELLNDFLSDYNDWREKFDDSWSYHKDCMPGEQFLKLVKETHDFVNENRAYVNDDNLVSEDFKRRLRPLQQRFAQFERQFPSGREFVEFCCSGHEFFKVSKAAWDKAKEDGFVDATTNKLTDDWLRMVARKFALHEDPAPAPDESQQP